MVLRGDLITSYIWEVLQLLSTAGKTGKLILEYEKQTLEIFLERGYIVNVTNKNFKGEELLSNIALFNYGTFNFIPEQKSTEILFNLSPFEVLVNTSNITDTYDYLEDFIFLPVAESSDSYEKLILENLEGMRNIKEVLILTGIPAGRFLETFKKLLKDGKIIEVKTNNKFLYLYIFYRYWNYILKEFPKRGVNERTIRGEFQEFLYRKNLKIGDLYNEITERTGVKLWININKSLEKYSETEIENFTKEALFVLLGLSKEHFSYNESIKSLVDKEEDKIYVPIKNPQNPEEEIIEILLDGIRTLKDVKNFYSSREDFYYKTINNLIRKGILTDILSDSKLKLIRNFWIEKIKKSDLLSLKIIDFSSLNDASFNNFLEYTIIYKLTPSWKYIYQKFSEYSEEYLKEMFKKIERE